MNVCFAELGRIGRLGNALYEMAATAGIAHTMGVEPRFNADWIHRPFFSVPDSYFVDDWDHDTCTPAHYTPNVAHIDERARIYLQDINLFADILPTIRDWLRPSPLAAEIMATDPQVAEFEKLPRPILTVHVRRGDNAPGGDPGTPDKHLYHPMPPLSYYETAIERFDPPAGADVRGPSVAVFGDDPDWNKANIDADYYHCGIVRPKEHEASYLTAPVLDWIDWQLLTRADMAILANSTFGIFAALCSNADPVIYPWPMFGPRLEYINAAPLFPASWTRLKTEGG